MHLTLKQLKPHDLEYDYHGITNPKLLEMAVNNRSYPPAITCVVTYREELRRTGNPAWVILKLLGADNELTFMCKAYEQASSQHLDVTSNGEGTFRRSDIS